MNFLIAAKKIESEIVLSNWLPIQSTILKIKLKHPRTVDTSRENMFVFLVLPSLCLISTWVATFKFQFNFRRFVASLFAYFFFWPLHYVFNF